MRTSWELVCFDSAYVLLLSEVILSSCVHKRNYTVLVVAFGCEVHA